MPLIDTNSINKDMSENEFLGKSPEELAQLKKYYTDKLTEERKQQLMDKVSTGLGRVGNVLLQSGGIKPPEEKQSMADSINEFIAKERLKQQIASEIPKTKKEQLDDIIAENILSGASGDEQVVDQGANIGTPIDTSRPMINNPDGSFSTEKTITVGMDDKFYNIPTIINGKEVSKEEAINYAKQTGQNVGVFNTEQEALTAAQNRSNEIGRIKTPTEANKPRYEQVWTGEYDYDKLGRKVKKYKTELTPEAKIAEKEGEIKATKIAEFDVKKEQLKKDLNSFVAVDDLIDRAEGGFLPTRQAGIKSQYRALAQPIDPLTGKADVKGIAARAHDAAVKRLRVQLVRAAGDVGNINIVEQEAAEKLIPGFYDSAQSAKVKRAYLQEITKAISDNSPNAVKKVLDDAGIGYIPIEKKVETAIPTSTKQKTGGQMMEDAQGNRAMVYPDGSYEEIK